MKSGPIQRLRDMRLQESDEERDPMAGIRGALALELSSIYSRFQEEAGRSAGVEAGEPWQVAFRAAAAAGAVGMGSRTNGACFAVLPRSFGFEKLLVSVHRARALVLGGKLRLCRIPTSSILSWPIQDMLPCWNFALSYLPLLCWQARHSCTWVTGPPASPRARCRTGC